MFNSFFIKIAALFVVIPMILFCGISNTEPYDVKDPENVKLNFTVISDTHIEGNNFNRYKVFERSLKDVKKNKSGNDAVVFLGDNTMNGQFVESLLFYGTAATILRGENVLPALGNHDIGNGEGDYDKLQKRYFNFANAYFTDGISTPYYYKVIDGYYFIVLGMESHEVYDFYLSDAQYEWLEDVLEKAAESGKPAFVFCHYSPAYAIDENGHDTDRLNDIFTEYNKTNDIFYFYGHTHMPMLLYWSFRDYGYPLVNLPRITELYGAEDHEIGEDSGDGVEVEVYGNEVIIRARNFYTGQWKIDDLDEVPCEMTYTLKNPVE